MYVGKRTVILITCIKRKGEKSGHNLKGEGGRTKEQTPRGNFANLEREERGVGGRYREYEKMRVVGRQAMTSQKKKRIFLKVWLDVIHVSLCIFLRDSREVLTCFQLSGDVALLCP